MAPSLVQFDLAAGEGQSVLGVAGGQAFGEGEAAVVEVVHAANDFEEGGCIGMAAWRAFFGQLRCHRSSDLRLAKASGALSRVA